MDRMVLLDGNSKLFNLLNIFTFPSNYLQLLYQLLINWIAKHYKRIIGRETDNTSVRRKSKAGIRSLRTNQHSLVMSECIEGVFPIV